MQTRAPEVKEKRKEVSQEEEWRAAAGINKPKHLLAETHENEGDQNLWPCAIFALSRCDLEGLSEDEWCQECQWARNWAKAQARAAAKEYETMIGI